MMAVTQAIKHILQNKYKCTCYFETVEVYHSVVALGYAQAHHHLSELLGTWSELVFRILRISK